MTSWQLLRKVRRSLHPLIASLPSDSALHYWIQSRAILETPVSFDLGCGLSGLGAALRRNLWVSQIKWNVYPNLSILLVGPSGVGKNTAINGVEELLAKVGIRIIGGKTIETLTDQLCKGNEKPACAVMMAKELSDFIGKKDYQQGLLQGITDMLDTGEFKDITIKSDLKPRRIQQPTVTIMAGSTAAWLHKAMPPESMAGGFFPRFLILCEKAPKRQVPLVSELPLAELAAAEAATKDYETFYEAIAEFSKGLKRMELMPGASTMYQEWYCSRQKFFSAVASEYAHRSRDHALRLAMLCAVSAMQSKIREEDVAFGLALINHVGARVDEALAAPSIEAEICKDILGMLPASRHEIIYQMAKAYGPRNIRDAIVLLEESRQVTYTEGHMYPCAERD